MTCSLFVARASVAVFLGRRVPTRLRIPFRRSPVSLRLLGRRLTRTMSPGRGGMLSEALAQSAPVGCGAAWRFSELIGALPHRRGVQCPLYGTRAVPPYILLCRRPAFRFLPLRLPADPRFLFRLGASSGPGQVPWGGHLRLWSCGVRCYPLGRLRGDLSPARSLPSLPHCGWWFLGRCSIAPVVTRGPLVLPPWSCL